jgi:hypothetical protein
MATAAIPKEVIDTLPKQLEISYPYKENMFGGSGGYSRGGVPAGLTLDTPVINPSSLPPNAIALGNGEYAIPVEIPGLPQTDAKGYPVPKFYANYGIDGKLKNIQPNTPYWATTGQGENDIFIQPSFGPTGELVGTGENTNAAAGGSDFISQLGRIATETAPIWMSALGANLFTGANLLGGGAGAGAAGAGAAGAAGAGVPGGLLGSTLPAGAGAGGFFAPGVTAGAATLGIPTMTGAPAGVTPSVAGGLPGASSSIPTPSAVTTSTVAGAPAAAAPAAGAAAPVAGATAGTGAAAAAGGTGLISSAVDFAKENPNLTGAAIGAITGAIDAANAPKEQTTTTSIDPDIKREYMANLDRAKAAAAGLGVRQFEGFTDDYGLAETQLKNLGLGGKGQQTTDEAARLAMIEAGFTPQQIAAAQANRGAVQDVTGQLGSQYMSAYFNPYEEQVVQGTLGDIERSRQMQDVADRARATQARAFGGSRQGVQSALTNEAALRQAGTTAAGLRQAGFSQAAQFGQSDAARQLQAQMANQGVSLTLEQANAQLRQQAALANQQAGISGAGLRQSAISQLGQLGAQQQNLGLTGANAVMLAQMERQKLEQQRLDAMRNLPLERLGITGGALGLQPARTGETSTQPLYSSGIGSALSGGLTGAYIGSLLKPT